MGLKSSIFMAVWIFFLCRRHDCPKRPKSENSYWKCVSRHICSLICVLTWFQKFEQQLLAIVQSWHRKRRILPRPTRRIEPFHRRLEQSQKSSRVKPNVKWVMEFRKPQVKCTISKKFTNIFMNWENSLVAKY